MIGESILELHETNATDESIKSYEYNVYQPITGTQLNSAGQITITIENQDQFLHLQNSYLLIEGEVLKADNARYADADLIALTNNGLLYLFSNLKLTLAGQEVEHVNYLGHATSLLGLASYSSEYQKGCGLAQGWYAGTSTAAALANVGFAARQPFLIRSPDPKGSFQCAIPMKHIFGFMDDYTKVTYGMRDTLQVMLNHSRYPSVDMPTDFVKEQFAGVYKSFCDFASRYYGIDNLLAGSAMSPIAFKSL